MRPKVYLETSVINYLAGRPSRDVIIGARQQLTQEYWDHGRSSVELFVSESVIREISAGDTNAAAQRLLANLVGSEWHERPGPVDPISSPNVSAPSDPLKPPGTLVFIRELLVDALLL